ncbi:hypothetical protein [Nocardioides cynanchi]|uniref:hypothetical protein n=1 Tax=Nocardioides cynanchi TaxID=2558918 RepID=UPI001245F502|nr:hypothetical protein [Nocardioides cynanchi]
MTLVIDAAAPAADKAAVWVKLGNVVFRTTTPVESHVRLTLMARPASEEVATAIEGLRPTTFNNPGRRLTWSGRSLTGRVVSVERTGADDGAELVIVFERRPEQTFGHAVRGGSFSTSTGTHTSDEMLRLAVRQLLFGEVGPLGAFSPRSPVRDFLADLPDSGLPDEVHEAAFGLLAAEALNESGLEVHVTRAEMSPPGPGGRRVRLAWTSRDSTGTRAGTAVEVDGVVPPRPPATRRQRAERLARSRRWPPLPGRSST